MHAKITAQPAAAVRNKNHQNPFGLG
jgi:hypothetical protein